MKAGRVEGSDRGSLKRGIAGCSNNSASFRCDGVHQSKQTAALKPDPPRGDKPDQLIENIDNI